MSVPADPPPPYDDALSVPQVHSADISLSGHSEDALSQTSASFSVPPPPPSVPPRPAAGVPVQIPSISDPIRPLPTVTAQFGKPLLRDENLLVYPKGWIRCERCGNTGFKASDPERPCKRCWRKYGRTYKGVLKQAFESNEQAPSILQDVVLQAPIRRTSYIPAHPTPVPADWGTARPMYPQQPAYAQLTPQGNVQNYSQYPTNVAARPPARPEVFPEDAHQSVPPTYHLASTTANEKPLSDQQYPNARPPVQPQAPHPPQPIDRSVGGLVRL
ncbi:hypothetical protein MVES1_000778 [Malassezia vespertilionis]|uniref:uncharacterized protein n=1 Tax=Malassezia vespertilionis TaxID=2020962 RepID=UPI0024B1D38D|nr:uncharacterized protein MVES1_000778 [Malassezia vespertilionis]WFD05448.1 hypothetical protein MVES1_000778 [Malassezia vespertilionis]